uniref:Uncharacterized protein n=1 Tax=Escherichia coli TaxID=562 RepID=A0A3G4RXP4_ECOLX|nr:hypothetical protein D0362_00232 [Escherichia coli]
MGVSRSTIKRWLNYLESKKRVSQNSCCLVRFVRMHSIHMKSGRDTTHLKTTRRLSLNTGQQRR